MPRLFVALILTALSASGLLAYATSAEFSARVRNSLIYEVGTAEDWNWHPVNAPAPFVGRLGALPDGMAAALADLKPREERAAWSDVLPLARHLSDNRGASRPLQASTIDTYRGIRETGDGYCADYTQVFVTLALGAEVFAREWALSFEGFGVGHVFNEVYAQELQQWVFVDSFYSFYVRNRSDGRPLSVMELQAALRADQLAELDVVPIDPERFAFDSPERALRYYQRGADQFYLIWGNDYLTPEATGVARILDRLPRPVEVFAAILLGIHPRIVLVPTDTNAPQVARLRTARWLFLGLLAACLATGLWLCWTIWTSWSRRRADATS